MSHVSENILNSKNNFSKAHNIRKKITHRKVLNFAENLIVPLLSILSISGNKLREISRIILLSATSRISINQAVKKVKKRSSASAIRYHLRKKQSESSLEELEYKTNKILYKIAKTILHQKWVEFAIDFVCIPYHGKPLRNDNEIIRSHAKSGTTHFHAYTTLYMIILRMRFTLTVKYVRKNTPLIDVVEFMLKTIKKIGLRIKCIYFDKGFYSIPVVRLLKRRHVRAVIAAPAKGDKHGIKSLFGYRKSKVVKYRMISIINKRKESENIKQAINCKYAKNKYGRKGTYYFAYVLICVNLKPKVCYEKYRKRFGIETSYRLMNAIRARTSSQSPNIRLIYIAVSLILQNAWVYINWSYMRERKQGQRSVKNGITLHSFTDLIIEGIKSLMGTIKDTIVINIPKVNLLCLNTITTYLGVI